jgi:hypothetical protein
MSCEALPVDDTPAELLDGRYRLLERIDARRGASAVYRAEHVELARVVAVRLVEAEPEDRLECTARALSRLAHPNVARVYSLGRRGPMSYVATEFVSGPKLEDVIRCGREGARALTADRAIALVEGMAAGLDALRDGGIVCGSFGTSDVIVDERRGRPVLVQVDVRDSASAGGDIRALARIAGRLFAAASVPELATFAAPIQRAVAHTGAYQTCELLASELAVIGRAVVPRRSAPPAPRPWHSRVRVLLVAHLEPTRSRVRRVVERALAACGDRVDIESTILAKESLLAAGRRSFDLVVIDEESARATSAALLAIFAKLDTPPPIVLVNACGTPVRAATASLAIKQLAPPLDVHLLGSILSRMGARIAERRAADDKGRE